MLQVKLGELQNLNISITSEKERLEVNINRSVPPKTPGSGLRNTITSEHYLFEGTAKQQSEQIKKEFGVQFAKIIIENLQ